MTEAGNLGAARQGGPLGAGSNQSGSYVTAAGNLPLANTNGPLQTISVDGAVDRYIQSSLVTMPFLGISVTVHRSLATPLGAVQTKLDYATNKQQHGIVSMTGKQGPGSGLHAVGCAIDFNYETSPFLMHEAGEAALDVKLADVYNRISRFILARASVIPTEITLFTFDNARRQSLFLALKEESDAMQRYFGLFMEDPQTFLVPYLASTDGTFRARTTSWLNTPITTAPNWQDALRQIQQDWVTLTGRSDGPMIAFNTSGTRVSRDPCDVGMCYPTPSALTRAPGANRDPDAPFANKGTAKRDPRKGFLTFDYEVVAALMDAGFTWGATGFGPGGLTVGGSGDVMHFELSALGKKVLDEAKRAVSP